MFGGRACYGRSRNTLTLKTNLRASLKLNGTLSSILTNKLVNPQPCSQYEPPQEVLDSARKATSAYNKAHSSTQSPHYFVCMMLENEILFTELN